MKIVVGSAGAERRESGALPCRDAMQIFERINNKH